MEIIYPIYTFHRVKRFEVYLHFITHLLCSNIYFEITLLGGYHTT